MITILLPTTGRPTLTNTIRSLAGQPYHQLLIIIDGPFKIDHLTNPALTHNPHFKIIKLHKQHHDWGHTPRNLILPTITQGTIAHIDDDDMAAPTMCHQILKQPPNQFHLFQMALHDGTKLWKTKQLTLGNIGTPMFTHPANIKHGTWTNNYGGDHTYITQTIKNNPHIQLNWIQQVNTIINPHDPRWNNKGTT